MASVSMATNVLSTLPFPNASQISLSRHPGAARGRPALGRPLAAASGGVSHCAALRAVQPPRRPGRDSCGRERARLPRERNPAVLLPAEGLRTCRGAAGGCTAPAWCRFREGKEELGTGGERAVVRARAWLTRPLWRARAKELAALVYVTAPAA